MSELHRAFSQSAACFQIHANSDLCSYLVGQCGQEASICNTSSGFLLVVFNIVVQSGQSMAYLDEKIMP